MCLKRSKNKYIQIYKNLIYTLSVFSDLCYHQFPHQVSITYISLLANFFLSPIPDLKTGNQTVHLLLCITMRLKYLENLASCRHETMLEVIIVSRSMGTGWPLPSSWFCIQTYWWSAAGLSGLESKTCISWYPVRWHGCLDIVILSGENAEECLARLVQSLKLVKCAVVFVQVQ